MKIQKKHIKYIIFTMLIALALLAFDVRLKTVYYTITSDKINTPMRIALITDLHSCKYGADQKTLIDAVDKEKPDVILLGGDIFDDVIPDDNTKTFLTAIAKRYPCYYVTGNHEYWSRHVGEMLAWLDANGIEDIGGKTIRTAVNGNEISLSGLNDPDEARYTGEGDGMVTELERAKIERDDTAFTMLLTHRPSFVNLYKDAGFDLVLAGHAHGGQWRLPPINNGVFAPNQGIFPKYAGGVYEANGRYEVVSRGLARGLKLVPRLNNPPEIVLLHLRK